MLCLGGWFVEFGLCSRWLVGFGYRLFIPLLHVVWFGCFVCCGYLCWFWGGVVGVVGLDLGLVLGWWFCLLVFVGLGGFFGVCFGVLGLLSCSFAY